MHAACHFTLCQPVQRRGSARQERTSPVVLLISTPSWQLSALIKVVHSSGRCALDPGTMTEAAEADRNLREALMPASTFSGSTFSATIASSSVDTAL